MDKLIVLFLKVAFLKNELSGIPTTFIFLPSIYSSTIFIWLPFSLKCNNRYIKAT